MSATDWPPIVVAGIAVCGAVAGAIRSTLRWAKAQAKAELLQEQSAATITAKNLEITDLDRENAELREENHRLWTLLQEKSQ